MARFGKKTGNTNLEEIADVIIAEWFRIVPEQPGDPVLDMDVNALTAALRNILDLPCLAVPDEADLVHVVIPYPPATNRADLQVYFAKPENNHFKQNMTQATIFGCGR